MTSFNKSEMVALLGVHGYYAHKAVDTADIVRDGMFSPPSRLGRPKRFPATLAGPQVCREKVISAVVAILQPQNRSNTKSISNDPDLFT
jgi:hypothetical protein